MNSTMSAVTEQTKLLHEGFQSLKSAHPDRVGQMARIEQDLYLKLHVRLLLESMYPQKAGIEWLSKQEIQFVAENILDLHPSDKDDREIAQDYAYFESAFGKQARVSLAALHLFFPNKSDEHKVRRVMNRLHMESLPQLQMEQVKNLVLAGGGAKAMSLSGFLSALDDNSRISIHRVAGTSGGAILAMSYAIGLSGSEIRTIVKENNFGIFTMGSRADGRLMNAYAQWAAKDNHQHNLHAAVDLPFYHQYHKNIIQELSKYLSEEHPSTAETQQKMREFALVLNKQKDVSPASVGLFVNGLPKKVIQNIERIAKISAIKSENVSSDSFLMTQSAYQTPRQAMLFAIRSHLGMDLIREFLADIIETRMDHMLRHKPFVIQTLFATPGVEDEVVKLPSNLELRNRFRELTFNELYSLHQISMSDFRELHVSMAVRRHIVDRMTDEMWRKYRFEDASHESGIFADLPIVDAVRVSMNLPGVYPEYRFSIGGIEYGGVDGGLLSNLSMDTFDSLKEWVPTPLAMNKEDGLPGSPVTPYFIMESGKYKKVETVGVFYQTKKELLNTPHFSNILTSNKSVQALEQELHNIRESIEALKEMIATTQPSLSKLERLRLDIVRKQGKYAAVELEMQNKIADKQSKSMIGSFVSEHFRKKNSEYGHRSIDVRRLAMVNTGTVDTPNFKLSLQTKDDQFNRGYAAGVQLLSNSHCLENVFYQHMLNELGYSIEHPKIDRSGFGDVSPDSAEDVMLRRKRQ